MNSGNVECPVNLQCIMNGITTRNFLDPVSSARDSILFVCIVERGLGRLGIFSLSPRINFNGSPSSGSHTDTRRQTDV
jgi:hypothetical protein